MSHISSAISQTGSVSEDPPSARSHFSPLHLEFPLTPSPLIITSSHNHCGCASGGWKKGPGREKRKIDKRGQGQQTPQVFKEAAELFIFACHKSESSPRLSYYLLEGRMFARNSEHAHLQSPTTSGCIDFGPQLNQ